MRAYKALKEGRSEFTEWRWPLPVPGGPGEWVKVAGPLALCVNGVHASSITQLPHWLGLELWEIELAGEIRHEEAALVASQARLIRRIEAWDEPARRRFACWCLERAHTLVQDYPLGDPLVAKVEHTVGWGGAPPAGYFTAMLAGERAAGRRSGSEYDRAFLAERTLQARWLRRELALAD
jgi:hypothetical protein